MMMMMHVHAARASRSATLLRQCHPQLQAIVVPRSFSTNVPKDDDDASKKELSPFQRLQKWMQPFVHGSKELYLENKQAWQIRSRLKASGGEAMLTRQEMMVLRQAHRDLLKSLPLLAFFAIPLVGYAAPLVGYQFPKQLLPWQFWRPDQKTEFFRQDAEAKAAFYPELVKLLIQIDNKEKLLKELLESKRGLNPEQAGEFVPFFDENGPADLSKLSAHHVHVLTRSVALFPAFSALTQLIPKSFLQQHLAKRMDELRVDDQMLLKEGIEQLSLSELEFACEERGIVRGYGDIEALRAALREWLSMYDTDHANAPQLPASLLLHAPAMVRFSASKTA
uniref:Letm1 RBD domain-containing protein n=1 Tax=Globisporangium ultimum (strain ATCC 200006 / CBS 805.95 / DAOM BR144) TaxID=431595 RepID=K3WA91_GLOUD